MTPTTSYRAGRLFIDDCAIDDLAAKLPTPFYAYSQRRMEAAYRALMEAVNHPRVTAYYAVKANSNVAVIKTFAQLGAGADIVSIGEMERCLKASFTPGRIVFSGVGKTVAEMKRALELGVHQINVESLPELHALSAVAKAGNHSAKLVLRINPDVDAGTHAKISTGKAAAM